MNMISDQIVMDSSLIEKQMVEDSNSYIRRIDDILINVEKLEKNFGDFTAVDSISFEIKKGELFSLLGPNGAGKSTTIRMLTTVLKPSGGVVSIKDFNLKRQRNKIKQLIGVCPQENVLFSQLSAEENMQFAADLHGMDKKIASQRIQYLLKKMNLADRDTHIDNFSGGMKRRLSLIMSMVHLPQILFLDEPTAGLDPQAQRLVWEFIQELRELGITIILTTHNMLEAEKLSDYVCIIDNGKIIARGTPDDLISIFAESHVLEIGFQNKEERGMAEQSLEHIDNILEIQKLNGHKLIISFRGGLKTLRDEILKNFDEVSSMKIRQKSLEDVFLKITGRSLRN